MLRCNLRKPPSGRITFVRRMLRPLRPLVQVAPVPSPDGEGIKGRGDHPPSIAHDEIPAYRAVAGLEIAECDYNRIRQFRDTALWSTDSPRGPGRLQMRGRRVARHHSCTPPHDQTGHHRRGDASVFRSAPHRDGRPSRFGSAIVTREASPGALACFTYQGMGVASLDPLC